MSLDSDLQAHLQNIVGSGVTVEQNTIVDTITQPRVWFQRQLGTPETYLNGQAYFNEQNYDIECQSLDPDTSINLAQSLFVLNGYSGLINNSTRIQGTFCEEQKDDYIQKGLNADEGFHVSTFILRVIS